MTASEQDCWGKLGDKQMAVGEARIPILGTAACAKGETQPLTPADINPGEVKISEPGL